MLNDEAQHSIEGIYHDGVHPRGVAAVIAFERAGEKSQVAAQTPALSQRPSLLRLSLPAGLDGASVPFSRRCSVKSVDFGEPTQYGSRLIRFSDGGQFTAHNMQQLHAWLDKHQQSGGWVSRITLQWPWVVLAFAATALIAVLLYLYGISAFANWAAPKMPVVIAKTLGDQAFEQLDKSQFKPTQISEAQQQAIRQRWQAFLDKQPAEVRNQSHTLYFRSMRIDLSTPDLPKDKPDSVPSPLMIEIPNAMALPNGAIVLTDGLVNLLADKPDAVMGVLAHELTHLKHQHSLRILVEVSALSGLSALVFGDTSGLLAQAPLLLGALSYSRDHESEADDTAITMMRAAGVSSAELAVFFERARGFTEKLSQQVRTQADKSGKKDNKTPDKNKSTLNIPDWLSTHPDDAARIEKLRKSN